MRINVAFAVPPTSIKFTEWHDGFVAAMGLIGAVHEVSWMNVHPSAPGYRLAMARLFDCDFLLVKSNFAWIPDHAYMERDIRVRSRPPVGLMISGSIRPRPLDLRRFDVLFYETEWFGKAILAHARTFHAFGVDTTIMTRPTTEKRDIDWLMVGRPAEFKHPEVLAEREGTRMLVGEIYGAEHAVTHLRDAGVEVLDFVTYAELATIYQRTKTLLVAAELQGGGERAILEARACGSDVNLVVDNPKLRQVLDGPVYSHHYYADGLLCGIEEAVGALGTRVVSTGLLSAARLASEKARRAPNALKWHVERVVREGVLGR